MAENKAPAPRMALWTAVIVAVVIVVAVGIAIAPKQAPRFHGTTYTEIAPVAEFALVGHEGQPVSLRSFRGRPVLLFFGYTQCPDICPTTLLQLTRAIGAAGRRAEDMRVVLITVDPANDTPAALARYAARFGPAVVGLTGDSAALAEARRGYGAYVVTPAAPAPAHGEHAGHTSAPAAAKTGHTGVVYGIDRAGNLQVVISDTATPEQIADDVRTLAGL